MTTFGAVALMLLAIMSGTISNLVYGFSGKKFKSTTDSLMNGFLWMLISSMFYFVLCITLGGGLTFKTSTVLIAAGAGVNLVLSAVTYIIAMQTGSVSLTVLIASFGIVVPVILGRLFLQEAISPIKILGFLIIISVFPIIINAKASLVIRKKWIFMAVTAMLTNGVVMFFMKLHQNIMPGSQVYQYLFIEYLVGSFTNIIIMAFLRKRTSSELCQFRLVLPFSVILGTVLALNSFAVMKMSPFIPSVVLFPIMLGSMLIVTSVLSVFIFKEKIERRNLIGFVIGIFGIIILSCS